MTDAARGALVIVGASYAGIQLAASARELGFEERIVVLGDERHMPCQRPPLSKGLLTGKTGADRLALRGDEFFEQNRLELRLGERVAAVELAERRLRLQDGGTLGYRWLALATGARCRSLTVPGVDLENVLQLRTLDDALAVVDAASRSQRICVIGGGFIGLEVAAALRTRGASVTVVEARPQLLARSVPPPLSSFVERAHRRRGVELLTGRAVHTLLGHQDRVAAVALADGHRIDCDLVVLGIGVLPNAELAQQAGIAVEDGILTDTTGRTSAPDARRWRRRQRVVTVRAGQGATRIDTGRQ